MSEATETVHPAEGTDAAAGEVPDKRGLFPAPPSSAPLQPWRDRLVLATTAGCLVIAALGWFLLKEFASILRPLLLAVFLCYIILPTHHRLSRHIAPLGSMIVLAGTSVGLMVLLAWLILGSVAQLSDEMPRLIERAQAIIGEVEGYSISHLPSWLAGDASEIARGQALSAAGLKQAATAVARAAADVLTEAILVSIFLIFLLLEAARIPHRIQDAFRGERPEQILAVMDNINAAMAGYLRVKVKASLVLAVPATIVLWAFDVKFALMWGILTFLLNFIPYLGSIIACSAPILLAFLDMDSIGRPVAVALLLVSIHSLSAYVVEPAMTGKAVGISPVVILVALSFWGLCWGLTGMLLAVPLTVMVKIVLENVAFTRPIARLMAED